MEYVSGYQILRGRQGFCLPSTRRTGRAASHFVTGARSDVNRLRRHIPAFAILENVITASLGVVPHIAKCKFARARNDLGTRGRDDTSRSRKKWARGSSTSTLPVGAGPSYQGSRCSMGGWRNISTPNGLSNWRNMTPLS